MKDFTKCAVVDHVGFVTNKNGDALSKAEFKDLYSKVFKLAEEDGFKTNETVFTLKNFCLTVNPRIKDIDKAKYAFRHNSDVAQVYFICPTLYKKPEQELRKWFDRGIPVKVIDTKNDEIYDYDKYFATASSAKGSDDFFRLNRFAFKDNYTAKRRLLAIWGGAIDDNLNTLPAIRIRDYIVPDNYIKRSDHDALAKSDEKHITKPFTSAQGYLLRVLAEEPDAEVDRRINQLFYYAELAGGRIVTDKGADFGKFVDGDIELMNSFLEIDWVICTECGYPHCKRNFKDRYQIQHLHNVCEECDFEFEDDDFEIDRYFEDSENSDEYLDDEIDEELTEEEYFERLESEWDI